MGTKKLTDIPYVFNGHERQILDLYLPETSSPIPIPLIIYTHGGAFKFGSKESKLIPSRLVSKNYAVASLNYRLSGHAIFPAAIRDCKAAVRFLRAHAPQYNLDPTRFVAMGESAGAYMAYMVGLPGTSENPLFDGHGDHAATPANVLGTIAFYGPTEFLQMDAHATGEAESAHNDADSPESLFLGQQITKVPELVRQASPLEYIDERGGPVLIAHGTRDRVVAFHQSELLVGALKKKGREVEFHPIEGADHGFNDEEQSRVDLVVDEWLERLFKE